MSNENRSDIHRRDLLRGIGGAGIVAGTSSLFRKAVAADLPVDADGNVIPGFEKKQSATDPNGEWIPFSDRKIRVGIAGFGLCHFGAQFEFHNHPNVEIVAVSDLDPKRCAQLAQACGCQKTYPSCEEMVTDDTIEAVFIATDAPSHARLAILALEHGKHVASAVPAVHGSLEDAEALHAAVKKSGLNYMMFETSCYHADLFGFHKRYEAAEYGKIVYSEGEYYHYFGKPIGGYNPKTRKVDEDGWRKGLPPQWYSTHATAYYIGVTNGSFTEVSCMGMPSAVPHLRPEGNDYGNPFGTEVALFRTSEGGMSRMVVSWDTPDSNGEKGRVYGQNRSGRNSIPTDRPPLPPGVDAGHHGGSHGHLTTEFIDSILRSRTPWIDIVMSLNMTVPGIVAHQSALKDGELMKIPQYS